MFFLYILRDTNNQLYIGHTNNLKRRAKEHANKYGSLYTKGLSDPVIVYSEVFQTRSEAAARERQLKKWTQAKKEALICGDKDLLKKL